MVVSNSNFLYFTLKEIHMDKQMCETVFFSFSIACCYHLRYIDNGNARAVTQDSASISSEQLLVFSLIFIQVKGGGGNP